MHRRWALIALIALSLLPLRPGCDWLALQLKGSQSASVSLPHQDAGGKVFHVASHGADVAALESAAKRVPVILAAVSPALAVPASALRSPVAPPGAATPPRSSYYARSARILR